jgi:ubiquinone/menaquinone biosynthesis C-methylase UbiE
MIKVQNGSEFQPKLVRQNKPMTDHTEHIKKEFARQAETLSAASAFTDLTFVERIRTAIAPTATMRILDLGCGPGIIVEALAPLVDEVVAFDLTPEMLQKAQERCSQSEVENVRLLLGNGEKLPFKDGTFDVVVTRLTIHHLEDPMGVVSEMVRVTSSSGRVVVADIVSSEDPEQSELHNALEVLRDPSHVRMLPKSLLLTMIQESGLRIISDTTWEKERRFDEWAQIVNDPKRTIPLQTVMLNLASAGIRAGINLRSDGDTVVFTHRWLLVTAEKMSSPGVRSV